MVCFFLHQTFLDFQIKTYFVFKRKTYIIIKMLCHIVITLIVTFCDAAPHPPGHHYYRTHHQPMWRYVKPFTAFTWNKPKMAQPEVPVARAASKDVVDVAVGAGAFTTLVKIVPSIFRYLKLHLNILASLRCHAMFKVFR